MNLCLIPLALAILGTPSPTIVTKPVIYNDGPVKLAGEVVFDCSKKGNRPLVLVFHDWDGPDAYEHRRAEMLAGLGYVAFVADIFGQGVRPHDPKANMAEINKYLNNRPLFRKRASLALQTALKQPNIDPKRVGAIGYCFGGTTVIELAETGASLKGIVSFHGGLGPAPEAKKIKAKALICHGAADPFVTVDQLRAFRKDLDTAKVSYTFISYPGAVHAFTIPGVDKYGLAGAKYNAAADKKSWADMKAFFAGVLK